MKRLLLLTLLSACDWAGEPDLYGAHLVVDTPATVERADVRETIERAAQYWGVPPATLAGWRILVREGDIYCAGHGGHDGCTDPVNMTVTVRLSLDFKHSSFLHEVGHVAIGDSDHTDARWWDCEALRALWYDWANNAVVCQPYMGEWVGGGNEGTCVSLCDLPGMYMVLPALCPHPPTWTCPA